MAPGYNKRKRDHHGGHDFRPRLSPAEQRENRIRKGIAEIGEPSRIGRDVILRNLSEDVREASPESYAVVLAITRAVVFEQPHKISYLSFLFIDANDKHAGPEPFELPFLVLEMVHDELSRAVNAGDYDRFKVFLRFLCALAPLIENTDELVKTIGALVSEVASADVPLPLRVQLYKTALLAAVYLPSHIAGPELQDKFVDIEFPETAADGVYDYFFGEDVPFETKNAGALLTQAARKLKDAGWNVDFLAKNPLDQPDLFEAAPGEPAEANNGSATEAGTATQTPEPLEPTTPAPSEPTAAFPAPAASEPAAAPVEQAASPNAELLEQAAPSENQVASAEQSEATGDQTSEPADQALATDNSAVAAAEATPTEAVKPPRKTHRIREIHLPSIWPAPSHRLHSDAFCRIYLPTNGVETVPEPANVAGLLLRDVAVDVIRHMDFNRREVTRQLIALDMFFNQKIFAPPGVPLDAVLQYAEGEPTWKIEDIALEAVYSQMFDLAANNDPFPLVYYHTLLVEACVMAPQDIAPVLGRALRFLFKHFASADAELLFRAVDWFAHHVSNFAFTWKWNEWIGTLQLPEFHPQQVFVRELLAKQVRLSYPQRVRDVLPEEFQSLVPDTPDMPPFKFAQDEKVLRFVDALQNPADSSVEALLEEIEPERRADVLVTCICDLGNRSLTHASNWVAKTIDLVRKYATDEKVIVEAIFAYWQQSQWIGALVVGQFIKSQLVSPQTYVDFVASQPDLLLSSVGWEAIRDNVSEARRALEGLKVDEEWGDWWISRLHKVLDRKSVSRAEAQQREHSMEIDGTAQAPGSPPVNSALAEDVKGDVPDETDYEPQLPAANEPSEEQDAQAQPEPAVEPKTATE